jgi:molybdenum cofactor cytidylyltransferase
MQFGIVILAAGASSRLGQPKQALLFQGKTLLQHTFDTAFATTENTVIVVGAYRSEVMASVQVPDKYLIFNELWQNGIASSIQCGIRHIQDQTPETDALIFLVADQPYLSVGHLQILIAEYERTRQPIVASRYAGTIGIPALIHQQFFPELLALRGDAGAKKVLLEHADEVALIDFEMGALDIDTPEDYQQLLLLAAKK